MTDPVECPTCKGEGYAYMPNEGRKQTHPIVELVCRTCSGTGEVK